MRTTNIILKPQYSCQICLLLVFLSSITTTSCKKYLEVDPPVNQQSNVAVYENPASSAAVMTGVYSQMIQYPAFSSGYQGASLLLGLSADELINYSPESMKIQFYENAVNTNNLIIDAHWTELYKYIYTSNAVIEGVTNSKNLSSALKNQLTGEAKFVRAFCNFYLVNLFGDIPLLLTSDYRANRLETRKPQAAVYENMINDLTESSKLLSDDYLTPGNSSTTDRIRPNKSAARALLARIYLYSGKWEDAELQATYVINNTTLYSLTTNLEEVFLKNSPEAIWQLQSIAPGYNTWDGNSFILFTEPSLSVGQVSLSNQMLQVFDPSDKRKEKWIAESNGDYYAYKYKLSDASQGYAENLMVLRLAEQYLIRAEARVNQNKLNEAISDLNTIRNRAGLSNTTANDKASLLAQILIERQRELFTEWGHRWLDLKRRNQSNSVLSGIKANWQPTDTLFPIPLNEIRLNSKITQNTGY